MLTPIEVVLVALIGLQLVLSHMRKTSCDERVQMIENECRRQTINAYTTIHRHAFELYRSSIFDGRELKEQPEKSKGKSDA